MKVLVISNFYPPSMIGGYEVGCRQVVDALRQRHHDVLVLTGIPNALVPEEAHIERTLEFDRRYEMPHNLVHAGNVFRLLRAIERFRPDVVYLWHIFGLGGLGILSSLEHLQVPWVWHLMDNVPVTVAGLRNKPIPSLARELSRLDGSYLTCSTRVATEIERAGLRLNGAVEVLPNWITGDRPPPRQTWLPDGQLRIVTAGQVAPHKGIGILIDAAALLRDAGETRFMIDVYGRASDFWAPQRIEELGLQSYVRLTGFRRPEEMAAIYRDYDVYAFPTWTREPFAFAPLEAASQGLLVLMTSDCGNAEWCVDGVDCVKLPRTPEAFAGALGGILDGSIDIEALARRGQRVVWRDFHLDEMVPRIEAALESARQRPRRAAGSTGDVFRMAVLGERLCYALVGAQDSNGDGHMAVSHPR